MTTGLLGGWDPVPSDAPLQDPADYTTFAQRLTDPRSFGVEDFAAMIQNRHGEQEAFGALQDSAQRMALYSGNITSNVIARRDAYDAFIKQAKALTGATLENPLAGGYTKEFEEQTGQAATAYNSGELTAFADKLFQQKLHDLQRDNRDVATQLAFDPVTGAHGLALKATADFEREAAKLPGGMAAIAAVTGGIYGSRYDPLFLLSLAAGPSGAIGKSALARTATAALTQGAYNAGLAALEQPAVQAWRREAGLRSGIQPGLEEVGMAFLAGAIPGAALHGAGEVFRALRPEISRVLDGSASAADVRTVMEGLSPAAARDAEPVLRQGAMTEEADALAAAERPPGVSPQEHDTALMEAVRHAQDDTLPRPAPPLVDLPGDAAALAARPELAASDLPRAQVLGLARLSDEAYAQVRAGAVPVEHAAAVGLAAPDPLTHAGIIADLAQASPETLREARLAIDDALGSPAPAAAGPAFEPPVVHEPGAPEAVQTALAALRERSPMPTHDGILPPASTLEDDLAGADQLGLHADLVQACKEM